MIPMKRLLSGRFFLLGLIVLVAAAHRALLARAVLYLTPDAGSVGLMALHILEGEHPLFLYGFNYSGALVPYLTAFVFKLMGVSMVTFLLTPLCFMVGWVVFTYLLFKELFGHVSGLAAAWCIAVPDLVSSWYSMVPDCSYTPMFCLGTLVLWLSVRISRDSFSGPAWWVAVTVLGAAAGLALWTHMITAVYLLCGAACLAPCACRPAARRRLLGPLLPATVLFLVAVSPYWMSASASRGGIAMDWHVYPAAVRGNFAILLHECLPPLMFWPHGTGGLWNVLAPALLLAGGLCGTAGLVRAPRRAQLGALLPLLFLAVYLPLYLTHKMAADGAPRYLLPAWSLLVPAFFAAPFASEVKALRQTGGVLLAAWMSYHLFGAVSYGRYQGPTTERTRAAYARVIETARRAHTPFVMMVGDYYFGAAGQTLSFLARDDVRFLAANEERYQVAAQLADDSPTVAFATPAGQVRSLCNALDAVDAEYRLATNIQPRIIYDVQAATSIRVSIPPGEMDVEVLHAEPGSGVRLIDRNRDTGVMGRYNGRCGLLVDLGRPRVIDGFYLAPAGYRANALPVSYLVEGSQDGIRFSILQDVKEAVPHAVILGERIYVGEAYGWLDARFMPTAIRYLRITIPDETAMPRSWYVSELYLFEHLAEYEGDAVAEREAILDYLRGRPVRFTVADRWVSAALLRVDAPGVEKPAAFPRYNGHLRLLGGREPLERRWFRPAQDMALVTLLAVADETEALLKQQVGNRLAWDRKEFTTYAVFRFTGVMPKDSKPLWWNGFAPLATR